MLRFTVLAALYLGFAGAGGAYYAYAAFARDLPDDLKKMSVAPNRATQVYSADGELIGEFFLEKRVELPLEQIPLVVQRAFIAAEDRRFWEHPGFDLSGIFRAAWSNYRGTGTRQGASTITQQVTRMLMLSNERTYSRKFKELILSVRVERELSKRDILERYLNRVYLGHGAYGVQAAAQAYFGKDVNNVTPGEAALLAGLTQAPSAYSPYNSLSAARVRQTYVIERMRQDGYLTDSQARAAVAEPLALVDPELPLNHVAAPYFVEHVRRWAEHEYGHRKVLRAGLRIYTTLDMKAQRSAEAAVRDGLQDLDRRIGFRGPIEHLDGEAVQAFAAGPPQPYSASGQSTPLGEGAALLANVPYRGVVVDISRRGDVTIDAGPMELLVVRDDARQMLRWRGERPENRREARPKLEVGDVVPVELATDHKGKPAFALAQSPEVQGALLALEPATGRLTAMVGGYSFEASRFNRATQARRQIGSAMKPFIYLTALMHGRTQMDVLVDAPVRVQTASGVWTPQNYDGTYQGPMTLRTALAKSINTISVRLVLEVGVDAIITNMRRLGIRTKFPRHVSMALGTPDLSLIEVVAAIGSFANGGKRVVPRFIERVVTADGQVLIDNSKVRPDLQVIPPQYAYLVVDMMKAVVERGTGRQALILQRPAAGKTGTSTGFRDAWFMGYTPDLIAGVWVGRDDFTPIGARATGGTAALPIWLQFMRAAHPPTEPHDFKVPEDVVFVRANEMTGMPAPPGPSARWVPFARGTVPARFVGAARTVLFERSAPLSAGDPQSPPATVPSEEAPEALPH